MSTLMLLGCSAAKKEGTHPAGELYTGEIFRLAAVLARAAQPAVQRWYVLSARWGFLPPARPTDAYDHELRTASDRRLWAQSVLPDIVEASLCAREPVRIVVIAGSSYRGWIDAFLERRPDVAVEVPLEGLGIGHQKAALNSAIRTMRGAAPCDVDERWELCLEGMRAYRQRETGHS